ncbi:hypothetical protein CANARDRAFT_174079 [[Candida] arabinofermentans NRRL YB-2248]|uniref:Multicopper oxidase n=1 Tax=[Candida] arabinofermentans NRRL YB-2248 TaxID=983967 RepID=A0A1E4T916_9ASCO|nr:hypothetical protein CANARDRAFT_174079 [[Candida] arabinofermentans NRRL YB-2248]
MCVCVYVSKTHTYYFNASYILANPDGVFERQVISFNGSWPLPTLELNKGDRLQLTLYNGLGDTDTSLHFHGLFQNGSNHMDGPVGVTQCSIPPGMSFTYDFKIDQAGTYWYHSHSGAQYSDGLRGLLIVHDLEIESNYKFDHELQFSISDWYHDSSEKLIEKQLTRYNPTGAEPVPSNSLFNDTKNVTINVEPEKTYLIRLANIGIMVSQFIFIQDHDFEIIEVDGVYLKPTKASMIYLSVGQRMSILLKTKSLNEVKENFCFIQTLDTSMMDIIPNDLQVTSINYLTYDDNLPNSKPLKEYYDIESYKPYDDFNLKPIEEIPLLPEPDHIIEVTLHMDNLGDGINYAFFNNYTYVEPKIPTLLTALSSPEIYTNNAKIYGSNTNSFILNKGDIIDLIVNNEDDNKHPFHLHGHSFQAVIRSDEFDEPHHYNPDSDFEINKMPEYPVIRDTMMVKGNGYMVLRFEANNPGIWFFHCHLDFHLEQGLALTLIEAPLELQQQLMKTPPNQDYFDICNANNIPLKGNAAGNSKKWLDLSGENLQPDPLPDGFTLKGYIALFICTLAAITGLRSIYKFGMDDVKKDFSGNLTDEKKLIKDLIMKLTKEERIMSGGYYSYNSKKLIKIKRMIDELYEMEKKIENLN